MSVVRAALFAGLLLLDLMNAMFEHWLREMERMEPTIEATTPCEPWELEGSFREPHCVVRGV